NVQDCMMVHTNVEHTFKAMTSSLPNSGHGLGALLITNMLFDEPIGFEVQGHTEEPLIVPEGKTFMYKLQEETRCIKARITCFLGHEFDKAIWTRKQLIRRPRIPLKPNEHVPQQMSHPAYLGGDGNMVRAMQNMRESNNADAPELYFANGCPWFQ